MLFCMYPALMDTKKIWVYLPFYMGTGTIFLPLFQVKVYPGDESKSPYRSTYCETYVLNAKRGEISVQVHVHSRWNYLLDESVK